MKNNKEKKSFICPTCNQTIGLSEKNKHMGTHNHENHENHNNHDNHKSHHDDNFPTYFWKLILGVFLLIFVFISVFVSDPSNGFLQFITSDWFLFFIATIVLIVYGIDYFVSSFKSLRQKKLSVNSLVSISIIASYAFSLIALLFTNSSVMFDATIEVAIIIYFGKYLEEYLSTKITRDLNSVLELHSKEVIILVSGEERKILPYDVKVDDIMVVYPGEKIPTDGIVVKGITEIDESTFTGEMLFITKKENDFVYGGTISKTKIHVKASKILSESILSKIIDEINEAKESKPETQKIADKIAQYLIPSVLVIAFTAFFFHLILGNSAFESFEVLVTVLVIACPCSFAMITPLSILVANGESAKKHIILNSKDVFEKITSIDCIVFDKTGTLTKGNISVIDYKLEKDSLPIIVSAERHFNHPISRAIVNYFKSYETIQDEIEYRDITGKGIEIRYKDEMYFIGSSNFLYEKLKIEEEETFFKLKSEGKQVIYFFNETRLIGHIILADRTKQEAKEVIEKIKSKSIAVYMVTGDTKANSEFIANEIGIDIKNVYTDVLPSNKSEIVKELQSKGKKVAFVGDGINDAIALEQSDLGISMGSANDIAIQSSDITIQNNNLYNVELALRISKLTVWTIYFGFAIAILYNIIFIPLASIGLLSPLIGAFSMAINDTLAMFIALSLKQIKFRK